jgi:sugar lactone lactonase YvrE
VVRVLRADHVAAVGAQLGECPIWDAARGELSFVDIVPGSLYRLTDYDRAEVVYELGATLAAALPATDGSRLLVTQREFRSLAEGGRSSVIFDALSGQPSVRFNDAKCDRAGRCFAGTLSLDGARAAGSLYRLDDGPRTTAVVSGVGLSNGLDWSPDGSTLYFIDTISGEIGAWEYDISRGRLGNRRVLVAAEPGTPDGMCADETGALWVAFWGRSVLRRFTPDGALDTIVELPVPNVTSCAFGGPAGGVLYITTATGLPPDEDAPPLAGDLFAVCPDVSGPAASPWRPLQPRAVA